MKSLIKFIFVAIALVSVAGVANAQTYAGGKRPDNSRSLEDQIFRKLLRLPNYGLFDHITYELEGNTVILGGSVASLGTRKDAERTVRRIPGVERVVNNIRELPPSSFDNQIRRSLVRQFANSPGLYRYLQGTNPSVRIIVDHGHVALEGYVASRGDANTMNILANGVPGVFSVENHLIVENGRGR
jgi:hyperosmotically inducible periplasmic protein